MSEDTGNSELLLTHQVVCTLCRGHGLYMSTKLNSGGLKDSQHSIDRSAVTACTEYYCPVYSTFSDSTTQVNSICMFTS